MYAVMYSSLVCFVLKCHKSVRVASRKPMTSATVNISCGCDQVSHTVNILSTSPATSNSHLTCSLWRAVCICVTL